MYNELVNIFRIIGDFWMKLLEEKIAKDGTAIGTEILKVDMFLNHQIDPGLIMEMGKEFYRLFKDCGATKVVTIESSGISIALATALEFGVPALFAKKGDHKNVGTDVYSAKCYSFTHAKEYQMKISKKYLNENDKVLIIDDFLAEGNALLGLIDLCNQAGAEVAGCAIAVEKGFQQGGQKIRDMGVRVESLAIVESMSDDALTFRSQD